MPTIRKTGKRQPPVNDKAALRTLTAKLAKQLLNRDAAATEAEERSQELQHQLEDVEAWSVTARRFVAKCKKERAEVQLAFSRRESTCVEREKRVKTREDQVDERVTLVATCHALERELHRAKSKLRNNHATHTETSKRSERREQELKFCKDEVSRLERTFVEHLHHVMKIQTETLSKIADDREMGGVQQANENARAALETKLAVVCAKEGAEKGKKSKPILFLLLKFDTSSISARYWTGSTGR